MCLGSEDGLFGDEAHERRHSGHAGGGRGGDQEQPRAAAPQPGQFAQVAGAGGVVDDPDHHEQRRLGRRVRAHGGQPGQHQITGTGSDQHDHQAQLADGAVGQQQLQVVLAHRPPARQQCGGQSENHQRRSPPGRIGEPRSQPRHQIDPGFDHRRGMQVGTDRCRCRHGAGQPEMQRHNRRLAERTDQDQQHPDGDDGPRRRMGHQIRQQVAAGGVAQHDDADQHGQPMRQW